jgi:hypothetical protein
MRGWISYPVEIALLMALGACAEPSRQRVNEAAVVEDGGDDGTAGDGLATRSDTDAARPDAARPDAARPGAVSPDAARPDAAIADAGARPFVPTMTTDAGPGLEPTRVFRGNPADEFWDLTFRGEGLEHLDGRVVTVRVGNPAGATERLGSGQARIVGGSFELLLAGVWEAYFYKRKMLYIDADQSGRCEGASDLVFHDARAVMQQVLTVRVSPPFSNTDLSPSTEAAEACEELNKPWPAE